MCSISRSAKWPAALERGEAACRQLASRARTHVRAARPRGATVPSTSSGQVDGKHAQLMSAFAAATESGNIDALTQMLASDVGVMTDGGGKVRSALEVIEGADRVARFMVEVKRKRPGAWWRDDFTVRFAAINGLPGVVVDASEGTVQTTAFEIEGDVIRALYVVRNPDAAERSPPACWSCRLESGHASDTRSGAARREGRLDDPHYG
jgi:RNA polymerase sigma-70 factor (ECF subfamily)